MADNLDEASGSSIYATQVLARSITFEGRNYCLHIASINPDDGTVTIIPFDQETPGTLYFDRPISLRRFATAGGKHCFAVSIDR